jgi:hypothetical protein
MIDEILLSECTHIAPIIPQDIQQDLRANRRRPRAMPFGPGPPAHALNFRFRNRPFDEAFAAFPLQK